MGRARAPIFAFLILPALELGAEDPETERASPLPPAELEARRKALEERIFEPAVLEASSFHLSFERSSSSFLLLDRRTGAGWHTALGRKGFATVFLRQGGRALLVDRVEDLRVEEKEIRFRGGSSEGEIPEVRFTLRVMEPLVGLEVSYRLPPEAAERVQKLRLLDGMLWVADADGGGAILPFGLGEWHPVDSGPPFERRFRREDGPWSGESGPVEPASMAVLGLVRGQAALLLVWDSAGVELSARRGRVEAAGFPGRNGITSSLDFINPEGAARLFPLGKGDAIDIAHSYRQLVAREKGLLNLRRKTEDREELRSVLGALVLRSRLVGRGPGGRLARSLEELSKLAERWRKVLDIDQALIILSDWNAGAAGEAGASGPLLPAAASAGGTPALADFARKVKGLGFLLGLEAASGEGIEAGLEALKSEVGADLLLVPAGHRPRALPGAPGPWPALDREALGAKIRAEVGIAGTDGAGEAWAGSYGYLEGLLSQKVLNPVRDPIFPLFSFAYGHSVRMVVRPEDALEPSQAERVLAHLILGEVPTYALPPPGGAGENEGAPRNSSSCFARSDGGWAEGKGLSERERFVKNTFEVLTHVARIRYRAPLLFHRHLTPDRMVEETYFGEDLRVVVNFGERDYADEEAEFTLPRFGFWVQHPFFHAFHAVRAHGVDYPRPALFTVRSLEGKMYLRAESVRIYHGFGLARIQLGGRDFEVKDEKTVKIW